MAFFITFCFGVSLEKMVTLTNNIVYKKSTQYRKYICLLITIKLSYLQKNKSGNTNLPLLLVGRKRVQISQTSTCSASQTTIAFGSFIYYVSTCQASSPISMQSRYKHSTEGTQKLSVFTHSPLIH